MSLIGKKVAITVVVLAAIGQLIGTGLGQYQKEQYGEAIKTFTKVIERYERNPYTDDAYYWRALSHIKLDSKAEARKDLLTILQKFPNSEYAGRVEAELLKHFGEDIRVKWDLVEAVANLIAQLGATSFVLREDASERLVQMGAVAVPALEDAFKGEDPEVKMRAEKILGGIKERQLLARLNPLESYVTLKAENVPLSKVLKEIEKQTGNHFNLDPARSSFTDKNISCEFKKVTFWQAVEEVSRKGNVYFQGDSSRSTGLRVRSGRSSREHWPTSYSGCLKIAANSISKSYSFQSQQSQMNISGQFLVEPRLRCRRYQYPQFTHVVDDTAVELAVSASRGGNTMSDRVSGHWNLSIKGIDREAREILEIEGTIVLEIPFVFEALEIKDVERTKSASARRGNYGLTVTATSRQNNRLTVELTIERTFEAGEGRRHENYRSSDFVLVDETGKEVRASGVSQRSGRSNNQIYTWTGKVYFPLAAGSTSKTLRFLYVSRSISKSVPFSLRNIPVP